VVRHRVRRHRAAITVVGWTPAPTLQLPSAGSIGGITVFGILAYVAYGCDFPRLNFRFSRLV
jgi:hypothetical protein